MAGLGSYIGRVAVSDRGQEMGPEVIAEWYVMMRDLKAACPLDRVSASSSHSYYRAPVCSGRRGGGVDVNVDGVELVLSPEEGVSCANRDLGRIVVKGCSLGCGGVWLSVTGMNGAFWLEIHVPMVATPRSHA